MLRLIHKSIAEGVGTFGIVFMGCGAIMVADRFHTLSPAAIPLIFGLIVAAMIYAVGHISGAHFNPAVTLAFAVARHFPKQEVPAYWAAQIGGGLLAMSFLALILPRGSSYGATIPSVPWPQALCWEILLTFFLMFVIIAVATDTRAVGTMAGAAIGATVAIGAYVGGPVTGASMNPARSLAPALFQNQTNGLWIYLLGPMIGAVMAALLYEWLRCEPDKKEAKGCC